MKRFASAWVELWDRREDAAGLALVRILVALVLAYDLLTVWHLDLIEALYARYPDGYAVAYDGWFAGWFGTGPEAALVLWSAMTIAVIAMALGAATRVACVVFFLVSAQSAHLAPEADRGIDAVLRIVVAILALSRCHARWSVDAWVWRKIGRPIPRRVPAWPRYLLLLQLLWIYFSGGTNKTGAEWYPQGGFAALANTLCDPAFARFGSGWVDPILPLTRVATAATLLFEVSAPLYIVYYIAATRERAGRFRAWFIRLRWTWIALGITFHVGIAITMRLGIFPLGMLALYPVLFTPAELARVLGSRIDHGGEEEVHAEAREIGAVREADLAFREADGRSGGDGAAEGRG
jgi:hypothetical protein